MPDVRDGVEVERRRALTLIQHATARACARQAEAMRVGDEAAMMAELKLSRELFDLFESIANGELPK